MSAADPRKEISKLAKSKRLTVIDATEPLSLVVTKSDISVATPKSPADCAFAVACKRQYQVEAAYFYRTVAWLHVGNQLIRYKLTNAMSAEIVAFDRAKAMAPGTYALSTIPPAKRSDARGRAARKRSKQRSASRVGRGSSKKKTRTPVKTHRHVGIR